MALGTLQDPHNRSGPTAGPAAGAEVPRSGTSSLERAALARARRDIAAMPASTVVQLVLWPETLAQWARAEGLQSAIIYNALHRVKPYRRIRERLARRLDVPRPVLDLLIDSPRPLASPLRPPLPELGAANLPAEASAADDQPRPGWRNGAGLLERTALRRLEVDIAAIPASLVVQLALWPETIAAWARREWPRSGAGAAALAYALLANSQRPDRIERALARRLGVDPVVLRALITARCPEPSSRRLPLELTELLPPPPPPPTSTAQITAPRPRRPPKRPPIGQLDLAL